MDFPLLVRITHALCLGLMCGAFMACLRWGLARLVPHRYAQSGDQTVEFASWVLVISFFVLSASAGALVTWDAFRTNINLDSQRLIMQALLLIVLAIGVIQFHLHSRPSLQVLKEQLGGDYMPLDQTVAIAFNISLLLAAWCFWVIMIMSEGTWTLMATLSALTLLVLVLWAFIASVLAIIQKMAWIAQHTDEHLHEQKSDGPTGFVIDVMPARSARPALLVEIH